MSQNGVVRSAARRMTESNIGAAAVVAPALAGLAFTSVTLGTAHACGLQEDGTAYCWGTGLPGNGKGAVRVAMP